MTQYSDPMVTQDKNADDQNLDGVRLHRWFKYYHTLCLIRDAALVLTVYAVINTANAVNITSLGILFIGWGLFEASYHYTRFARFVTGQENVLGVWNLTNSADVWLLNALRLFIGAGFILWGLR